MIRAPLFFSTLCLSFICAQALGMCQKSPGKLTCSAGIVSEIPSGFYGSVILDGTTVNSSVSRIEAGTFIADSSSLKGGADFTAGSVNFKSTKVFGSANLMAGAVVFESTIFDSAISLHAESITLKHTNIDGETSVYFSDKGKSAVINLSNDSLIKGDINFVGNSGHVCVDSSSAFTGKIINGDTQCV